jgi:two-component sensor histidine kinase
MHSDIYAASTPAMAEPSPLANAAGRRTLEQAIVDTVRDPLLVLDEELRVVTASRSYYNAFRVDRAETEGRLLFQLGNGQWNIPELRKLLGDVIPQHTTIEKYQVEHEFPSIGRRTMLLNARKIFYEGNGATSLLLAIEDDTERRVLERDKDHLLTQKDLLLREMRHRVNNSLSIIASILLLKAATVQSAETQQHLREAHERVLAIATVQEQLHPSAYGEQIDAGSYLTRLCESLTASMIPDGQPISLSVEAAAGTVTSEHAVSMGLIVTELVINALKHAFPDGGEGRIIVRFESSPTSWRLSVSDNGVGMTTSLTEPPAKSGLGTSIIEALTRQLNGRVTISDAAPGTTVSMTFPRVA